MPTMLEMKITTREMSFRCDAAALSRQPRVRAASVTHGDMALMATTVREMEVGACIKRTKIDDLIRDGG